MNLSTNKVILTSRSCKNMYVTNLNSAQGDNLTCLRDQDKSIDLWHRRMGHVSTSLLNKLVVWDLVCGLFEIRFGENKVCDACVKRKQTKISFKPKKKVSTSKPLEFIHMDLCGPVKIQSRGGKRYILSLWMIFKIHLDHVFKVQKLSN